MRCKRGSLDPKSDGSAPPHLRERDGDKGVPWQDWGLRHEKLPSVQGQSEASIHSCISTEA